MSPAPWTYDINKDRSRALIVDAEGFTVAEIAGYTDMTETVELMTAAPDLLALAERIARLPEHGHYLALIDEARAAIAKATYTQRTTTA